MMLQNLMESYLNNKPVMVSPVIDEVVPLSVKKPKWNVSKNKIQRVFTFEDRKQKEAFIVELIKYCRESDCDIEYRVRSEKVGVILFASAVEVSNMEFEAKKDIDKIRKDVVYYYAKEE